MKRLLVFLLCTVIVLSLCACGKEEPSIAPESGPSVTLSSEQTTDTPPQPEQAAPAPMPAPAPVPEAPVEQVPPAFVPTVSGEQDSYNLTWGEMQSPDFWIALCDDPQAIRMTEEEIEAYNASIAGLFETDVEDLASWPETMSRAKLLKLLNHYGPTPDSDYYTPDGPITPAQRAEMGENRNTTAVAEQTPVQYGFVTRNTILRTFPSPVPLYDSPSAWEYDKAAETAFKIWEPVLILHTSADGQWYLARAYDYLGWLPVTDAALCDRQQWLELCDALQNQRLTVTAARLALDGSFHNPEIDGTVLKMGTRLPLVFYKVADNAISDNCHIVQLPLREKDGRLKLVSARIPKQEDVCEGELPYTTEILLRQVFKLLGHRYGWGGTADGWDCSSICQDVFRTMGVDLPRNSGSQRKIPGCIDTSDMTAQQKTDALATLLPGAMLEMPGHQTMYIGRFEGEDYVIHATHGVYDTQGRLYEANSVIVSSVQARRSNGKSLLENFRGFSMPAVLEQ